MDRGIQPCGVFYASLSTVSKNFPVAYIQQEYALNALRLAPFALNQSRVGHLV